VPDDIIQPRGPVRRAAEYFSSPSGRRTAGELAVNILLPWAVYRLLDGRYGDFVALAASAAPPMLWSIYELARFRKLDALSLLVLDAIVLSLLALLMGGSPRLLMVRENLFSIPIGLAFLISAATPRPAIYYLAAATSQRQSAENRARFEAVWRLPHVLRGLRVMSIIWGAGLVAQGLVLGWMAWTWPIERYLLLSPIIGYGMIGILLVWTFRYRSKLRRRSEGVVL
jgi:hypothetical protein